MTSEGYIGIKLRGNSKVNFKDLYRLYENNYIKVRELFPEVHDTNESTFLLPEGTNNSRVYFKLSRESIYTSKLEINYGSFSNPELIKIEIEVPIYHDLKMAEVRSVNNKKLFWVRNNYPNKNMFHKDEKFQWNKFLSEWLDFSKKEGLSESYLGLKMT